MKTKLTIVKVGGNVVNNPEVLSQLLKDFSTLPGYKLLVHGGGKIASEISKSLGINPQMIEGRRVTDAETLKVITMVYGGLINKNIVAELQTLGCNAIGLTGADMNVIPAKKRNPDPIDFGFVGDFDPDDINVEVLASLINQGVNPVMAPLTHDQQGSILNTNADTIASGLAIALSKHFEVTLAYCFEKNGVLRDAEDDSSVIEQINPPIYQSLKAEGIIFDGMIPKLDNAFLAISKGVAKVLITHANQLTALDKKGTTLCAV
ncbi:acetylglutamate kinase [Persicobacter diffluens]|uniref:Acetylglutamate kinase n=1 Tax=Persicobacter diffluens TaxID=981 RepID=A0AAN5API8_9BACT|nr:acetylglutamate kinase [Persicobacter diffluens]